MTFDSTYVLHLGRFGRPRALPPKWAHANMEYCKKHTLLATHRFASQLRERSTGVPSQRLGLRVLVGSTMKGFVRYGVHWQVSLGMVHPPNGHVI